MQDTIEELIKVRRTLHQYPEMGYKEYKTSELICKKLQELGINYRSGMWRECQTT